MQRIMTDWLIDTEGVSFTVREWGSGGRCVVLIHGVGSNRMIWSDLAPRMVSAGYHVFAPDLRGSGESRVSEGDIGREIGQYVSDIANWTHRLQIERFVLAGHSFGGRVAAQYAAEHPNRVERLILIEPAGPDPLGEIVARDQHLAEQDEAGRREMREMDELQGEVLDVLAVRSQSRPGTPLTRACLLETLTNLNITDDGYARQIHTLETNLAQHWLSRRHDQRPVLKNITAPTIVLRASNSPAPLSYAIPHYADLIRDARFVDKVPGDHDLPLSNPDTVLGAIVDRL